MIINCELCILQMDPFARFRQAGPDQPSFFDSLKDNELKSRLEQVLGPLSPSLFVKLKPKAEADFEEAVTEYLAEEDLKQEKKEEEVLFVDDVNNTHEQDISSQLIPNNSRSTTKSNDSDLPVSSSIKVKSANVEEKKDIPYHLGSFQADIWCTRSGSNLTKFGEELTFESHDYTLARVSNSDGVYFARAREEDAKYIAPLIASNVCQFKSTVIYADSKLKLGSTVFIQVDCYLLPSAFADNINFQKDSNDVPKQTKKSKLKTFDESKETKEEVSVRLRQSALVTLFEKLGICKSNKGGSGLNRSRKDTISSIPTNKLKIEKSDLISGSEDSANDEVTSEQLDFFYKNTYKEVEELEPSPCFAFNLFSYQKRGLAWLMERDNTVNTQNDDLHPLWSEMRFNNGDLFYANLNSGELSLSKPTMGSRKRGGILADEMGLGKTISVLALIYSTSANTTLIVAPMSLLSQWESETLRARKNPKDCGCFVYYGNNSNLSAQLNEFLDSGFDRKVIITTYGIVASEHKRNNVGLFNHNFDRIVLDEAHMIKNRTTQTAKACFDLRGQRRWAVTGTPIVNRLEDLYSLIKFIGIEPWDNFAFWRAFIGDKFENEETRESAMRTVQAVVVPICLRRSKSMKDPITGKKLVELPPKTIEIKRIRFSENEQNLYSYLFTRVRNSVQSKVLEGTASSKYTAILALLLRLRQVCCHPLLLKQSTSNKSEDFATSQPVVPPDAKRIKIEKDVDTLEDLSAADLSLDSGIDILLEKFSEASSIEFEPEAIERLLNHALEDEECPICSENMTDPILTECLHAACRDCLFTHIEYSKKKDSTTDLKCHFCRAPIDSSRLFVVDRNKNGISPLNTSVQSTKIRTLISMLRKTTATNKAGKAVVFSQFTSFLDLIQRELTDSGFKVFRFDGSMSMNERNTAVQNFKSEKSQNAVFLLSLKAGGVGLNLVAAKYAYLMDPWWSYAVESQAIDRIHRMGQTEQVQVIRFIVENSIEEKMLKIQERKSALSSLVTEEEKQADNLENIRLLLDLPEKNLT